MHNISYSKYGIISINQSINTAANKHIGEKIIQLNSNKYWRYESQVTRTYNHPQYLQSQQLTDTTEYYDTKKSFQSLIQSAKQKYKDHIIQQCEHDKQPKMIYSLFDRLKGTTRPSLNIIRDTQH